MSLLLSDLTWDDLDAHTGLANDAACRVEGSYDLLWPYEAVLAGMTLVCQPRDGRLVVVMPDRVLREALERRIRELAPDLSMGEETFAKALVDLEAGGAIRRARGRSDPFRGCLELLYDVDLGNALPGVRLGVVAG